MKLFGQGAVNIAGHKVSYGLLAAVAGIAGAVLLFIQMRNSGSSVGAGSSPAGGYTDAQGNTYDANGNLLSSAGSSSSGADWQSAFSALSSQIGALSGGTSAAPSMAAPASPSSVPAASGYANYSTQWGNTGAQTGQPGAIPGGDRQQAPVLGKAPADVGTAAGPMTVHAYLSVPVVQTGARTGPRKKPATTIAYNVVDVPYVSAPALNQYNPVSNYGRGN